MRPTTRPVVTMLAVLTVAAQAMAGPPGSLPAPPPSAAAWGGLTPAPADPPAPPETAPLIASAPVILAEPDESHAGGLFASAEYLLWRARPGDQAFAVTDAMNDGVVNGVVQGMRLPLDSGLRVSMGYRLPGPGWDAGVTYTYFHSNTTRALTVAPSQVLYPTLTRPGLVDEADVASASARLDYDVFDLDIGRRWESNSSLCWRVFGGARMAIIDHDINSIYTGRDASMTSATRSLQFTGAGVTVGGEGLWGIGYGFGIFSKARASLLSGDVSTTFAEVNDSGAGLNGALRQSETKVIPVLDLAMGINWRYRSVSLAVGYEFVNWFGLMDFPTLSDDFSEGRYLRQVDDLSLNGLFFRAGVSF